MSQESDERDAIANEVFGSSAESSPESQTEVQQEPIVEPVIEVDPWAGVPPALREEMEGLRSKVGNLTTIEQRMKQAESRLGGVINELHAAKEAAKVVANAPSNEDIDRAATSKKTWDDLKENYPELFIPTDERFADQRADILKQIPDVAALRDEFDRASDERVKKVQAELGAEIVELKHPNFKETANSPAFKTWYAEQGSPDSFSAREVIKVIDDFTKYQASKKSVKQISAERNQRLESSQSIEGRRLPPTKSEADMTETELRAAVAKQVWG
jgi:hypothetical protein